MIKLIVDTSNCCGLMRQLLRKMFGSTETKKSWLHPWWHCTDDAGNCWYWFCSVCICVLAVTAHWIFGRGFAFVSASSAFAASGEDRQFLPRELCSARYWHTAAAVQFSSPVCTQAWWHQSIQTTTVIVIYSALPWWPLGVGNKCHRQSGLQICWSRLDCWHSTLSYTCLLYTSDAADE